MEPVHRTSINYELTNDEKFETHIYIYTYTTKSIVMTCSDHFGKSFSENLKNYGTYNPRLKMGKGWVFSNVKYPNLQQLILDISTFKIKGTVPYEAPKKMEPLVGGPLGILPIEPPIVQDIKSLFMKLADSKGKTVFEAGEHKYVWGEKDEVDTYFNENGKKSIYEFKTDTHTMLFF